jgi:UDPglucose 6-dehydrogenase
MIITFVGHGYVGLVTATVFADLGNTVWVIGHTPEKIEKLKKGILPIYEPGLEEMVKRNVIAGRLLFTMDYTPAVSQSDVVFIAVGTPPKENGEADLSVVFDVADKIGKNLQKYTVVITKSTVPVGTSIKVRDIIQKVKPENVNFDYASVPEFLREGQAISDTLHPDRVVIGTDSKQAEEVLTELHKPITTNGAGVHVIMTNIPTAEMIKYASNAFLATKISFANAIAQLSEQLGSDGPKVLEAIGLDKRIGSYFLNAGSGYGGSCFPKDVKALIAIAQQNGYDFKLLKDVEAINKDAMDNIVVKAKDMLGGSVKGKTIGILGLSFKPDTDDMRDAPSITVIKQLAAEGANIQAFDPIAVENAKKKFSDKEQILYAANAYEAAKNSELVILMTEWNEFKELNLNKLKEQMKQPNLIDGRNTYLPEKAKAAGFSYKGVGR